MLIDQSVQKRHHQYANIEDKSVYLISMSEKQGVASFINEFSEEGINTRDPYNVHRQFKVFIEQEKCSDVKRGIKWHYCPYHFFYEPEIGLDFSEHDSKF